MLRDGRLPAVLETLTTRPQPRRACPESTARISRWQAITLTSQACCQSSSGTSSRSRQLAVPALFTSTSTRAEALARPRATMRAAASGCGHVAGERRRAAAARPRPHGRIPRPRVAGPARTGRRAARRAPSAHSMPRGLAADSPARAGHDARLAREAEVHGRQSRAGSGTVQSAGGAGDRIRDLEC